MRQDIEQEAERMAKLLEPEIKFHYIVNYALANALRSADELIINFLLGEQAKREVVESHVG